MLRFILALIAVFALLVPAPADAGPLGRIFFRVSHPLAPIGSYAGPKGIGSGFGLRGGQSSGPACNGPACNSPACSGPACSGPACAAPAGLGVEPASEHHQRHTQLHNRDAQGVANLQAHYNRVGHHGGNPGYEGCGCAGSPAAAYAICCYANSGMRTVDVGYARSASGMWYCCRRYQ